MCREKRTSKVEEAVNHYLWPPEHFFLFNDVGPKVIDRLSTNLLVPFLLIKKGKIKRKYKKNLNYLSADK